MRCLKNPPLFLLIALIAAFIGIDQFTKWLAESLLHFATPVEVLPFLNWTLLYNTGAAFSFLSDAGGWQHYFFSAVAIVMSVIFFIWLVTAPAQKTLLRYSLALIIAGALGNLLDRLLLGHVVDFISIHWQQQYFFPAFNIADSAITLGTLLMLLDVVLDREATHDD